MVEFDVEVEVLEVEMVVIEVVVVEMVVVVMEVGSQIHHRLHCWVKFMSRALINYVEPEVLE